jgi:hypothetical protein
MKVKMTVSSIVQKLLEQGHITAEEALVLLKAELNKPCCPVVPIAPYTQPNPYSPPFQPYVGDPVFPSQPQVWYTAGGHGTTGGHQTLNDNFTSK